MMKVELGYTSDNIRVCDIWLEDFPDATVAKNLDLYAVQDEFYKHGFDVTLEAIAHNYEAWCRDLKSGYLDEENRYHLFTPCGCNMLSFRASEYVGKDWQTTYTC